ncbi:hypothetical protein BKP35_05045 [Anaerobacillus arseniciselenatis]|uniref:DUF1516 domain-containing protein n=2 Tax=Anaerobacillus arseniciselenatis TaxID=85682 RepID=A0A1S2LS61_9BACI|nr:hypothetical protein BKP35_05045 [Anaerobacillus arseniciselenatis]
MKEALLMPYEAFYHPHAYSWVLLVTLFVVSFMLYRKQAAKPAKITHMILRLFYVIMLSTGIALLVLNEFPIITFVKAVFAIYFIYLMEQILGRTKEHGTDYDENTSRQWFFLVSTLIVIVLIGYDVISF